MKESEKENENIRGKDYIRILQLIVALGNRGMTGLLTASVSVNIPEAKSENNLLHVRGLILHCCC